MPSPREIALRVNAPALFASAADDEQRFNLEEGIPRSAGGGQRQDHDSQTIENPPIPPAPCRNLRSEKSK